MGRFIKEHWRLLVYAVLLMTAFNYMSHGTQDLYPTFLQKQRGLSVNQTAPIAIIYNLGAICGGTLLGHFSQRWGRRRTIIIAAVLGIAPNAVKQRLHRAKQHLGREYRKLESGTHKSTPEAPKGGVR